MDKVAKRAYDKVLYEQCIEAGVCRHCRNNQALPGIAVCQACKADNTKNAAARRRRHRALGLCSNCCKPALPGQSRCENHVKMQRESDISRREKASATNRARYYANIEESRPKQAAKKRKLYRANLYEYRHKNSSEQRKRRHLAGSHTVVQWLSRVVYYGWRCWCCHCELTDATLTKDHTIPVTRGGTDWASNLRPACQSCNSRKGNRLLHR